MSDAMKIAGTISEAALVAMQLYFTIMEENGHTKEEAKEIFLKQYPKFMTESAEPVEQVKEDG